jgi:hypothetical protein
MPIIPALLPVGVVRLDRRTYGYRRLEKYVLKSHTSIMLISNEQGGKEPAESTTRYQWMS